MIVNGGPGAARSASQREVELAITKMLLAAGADPNASEPFQGCSAAFYAAQKGLDDILEVLVENGADLEMANKGGTNPMMLAAAIFDVPVVAAGGTARLPLGAEGRCLRAARTKQHPAPGLQGLLGRPS